MNNLQNVRNSQSGSAGVKFLMAALVLFVVGNAAINYIPVAYDGASFKQEMDTAVVKGLAAAGHMKPMDIVTGSVRRAATDYNVPADALVEIKAEGAGVITAHVAYTKQVNILPFGIYKYTYNFDYVAKPVGYLLKG
ncbi:MAG: hypothetical protein H7070_10645 [Saprospiraceae bacterium]|nr:hypothetical protein [Pyrinomonadaceae bacterium]